MIPSQITNSSVTSNLLHNGQMYNICNENFLRNTTLINNNNIQNPTICQYITTSGADKEVHVEKIIEEFILKSKLEHFESLHYTVFLLFIYLL